MAIEAKRRDGIGKGVSRQLRMAGRIPAVVYGAGRENINLSLLRKDWVRLMEKEGAHMRTQPHDLAIEGGETLAVLLRDEQVHPVSELPMHVDFLRYDAEKRIRVGVPVVIVGETECPGIKSGGVVQIVRHEVEVTCKAGRIPDHIEVSVAGLRIGESVHIEDIALPEGVQVLHEVNFTLAVVVGVKEEKEAPAEAAPAAEGGAAG
ncbi:MAG: 50S ribosomal protein L25/general stress protein Ctc [Magnetococcus sp. WYHC-3]